MTSTARAAGLPQRDWLAPLRVIVLLWLLDQSVTITTAATIDVSARITHHWRELVRVCPNLTYHSCERIDRKIWTNINSTQLSNFTFTALGAWSTFKLSTFDGHGRPRPRGGDSWLITLVDRAQGLRIATRVFDEGDGTYTVAAVLMKPGVYGVYAWLYYSDCKGYMDPHMPYEKYVNNVSKAGHCYLGERHRWPHAWTVDAAAAPAAPCMAQATAVATNTAEGGRGCPTRQVADPAAPYSPGVIIRADTYTYRQNGSFYFLPCCKPTVPPPAGRHVSRLLFYGDSTVFHPFRMMFYTARRPCRIPWEPTWNEEIYMSPPKGKCAPLLNSTAEAVPDMDALSQRCLGLPFSAVPMGTHSAAVADEWPGLVEVYDMHQYQFNDTRIRTHVPPLEVPPPEKQFTAIFLDGGGPRVLEDIRGNIAAANAGDVLVINLCLHYVRCATFDQWRTFVDEMAVTFASMMHSTGVSIIMRTSTPSKEHLFRSSSHLGGYVHETYFQTEARRWLYDLYAESVWQPLGVHVWDVTAYCGGAADHRPHDMVHIDAFSCWAQTIDMMDLFACKA